MIMAHDTAVTILEAMTLDAVAESADSARKRKRRRRSVNENSPAETRPPRPVVAGSVCTTTVWVAGGPEGCDAVRDVLEDIPSP